MNKNKTGIELITKERWEQVYKHGFGLDHDIDHNHGELAKHAAILAIEHTDARVFEQSEQLEDDWGLLEHIKEINKTQLEIQIHCLRVAGALIAAEIDRLLNIQFISQS